MEQEEGAATPPRHDEQEPRSRSPQLESTPPHEGVIVGASPARGAAREAAGTAEEVAVRRRTPRQPASQGTSLPVTSTHRQPEGADLFFRSVLSNMLKVYLSRNPTAEKILDLVHSYDGDHVCFDHFAFRTFGVDGNGINSLAEFFTDFGYESREELRFPAKKLRALWFSPPNSDSYTGTGIYGPLPRIFISELIVDELSAPSQEIIYKHIKTSAKGNKYAILASTSGELTWEKPIYSDFQVLSRESEYAAWTLVNGYALNHATVSTHRLESDIKSISKFNKFVEDNGFKLNTEGGILKVSPDGLLQQSSTVADSALFTFADGMTESIPRSYIEFAERLPLPQFKDLQDEEVKEHHRRDGFEVGNADKIFESTSRDQLTRRFA